MRLHSCYAKSWQSLAATSIALAADNHHDFAWHARSRMQLVLLRNQITTPALNLPMDASHASMEEIGEGGFEANWP